MLKHLVGLIPLVCASAHAMTWEFDTGTAGWWARESRSSGKSTIQLSVLRTEAADGVWRVELPQSDAADYPTVQLVSPPLNVPAALFDRVSVRVRLVGGDPVGGNVELQWQSHRREAVECPIFFEGDAEDPLKGKLHFHAFAAEHLLSGAWLEVTIHPLQPEWISIDGRSCYRAWEDTLRRIELSLGRLGTEAGFWPEAVEVDRIVLTGVEEQLQGELTPPAFVPEPVSGTLFERARYSPLGSALLWGLSPDGTIPAAVGPCGSPDGDDVVAAFSRGGAVDGWVCALGDASGAYQLKDEHPNPAKFLPPLQAADVDADGLLDLLLPTGRNSWALHIQNDVGRWSEVQVLDIPILFATADINGDGTANFLTSVRDAEDRSRIIALGWQAPEGLAPLATLSPEAQDGTWIPIAVTHAARGSRAGVLWCDLDGGRGYLATWLDGDGAVVTETLDVDLGLRDCPLIRYSGDIDADGDTDLLISNSIVWDSGTVFRGLDILENMGTAGFTRQAWLPRVELLAHLVPADVNADGLVDFVFTDSRASQPAVLVFGCTPGQMPTSAGRYPLSGRGGLVLSGDADNDGYLDLIVIESYLDGGGGVHVLLNRTADRVTAVADELAREDASSSDHDAVTTLPTEIQLHPAYPNPFNPETVIPFALPQTMQSVRLQIYNVMGQPVRTLVDQALGAGVHRVRWDGEDDCGNSVPSGVYFFRLQAAGRSVTGRCVRIE